MTGHSSHLPGSIHLKAASGIAACAWQRPLLAASCLALALGGAACSSNAHRGPSGSPGTGTGAAGSDPMSNPSGGTGSASVAGQSGSLTLDSGRTVIRRLNRTEYNFTVRDLLGTTMTPGDNLPQEPATDFFDTIGEFLSISDVQFETLESAASALTDELFALPATDARRSKVLVCTPATGAEATCARSILTTFARRAFRRPATAAEIDSLLALIDKVRVGGTYDDGLKAAITAVLLSPHFLYREETSIGVAASAAATAAAKPLNPFELATRLSYFLWSTMPDDALSASADSGKLASDPGELPAQIARMVADPKAAALTSNFAKQWLSLTRLDPGISFDPKIFPTFDDPLRAAAQQETATFFSHLIADNLPLSTLISADFTYANARLAKHYGLTDGTASGTSLVKVSLAGTPRAGLLTQASFLMGNAHPNVSSPVQRGNWVLQRILCSAPPPPPNNVDTSFNPGAAGVTARAVLEAHRADPVCGACHNLMDPLGIGLENFDAIGAYRTLDNGAPVDAHGAYPGGATFTSGAELSRLIAQDPRFPACVTKNLLTYGAGRSFSSAESLAYAKALSERALAAGGGNWGSWLSMVASSEAFRSNRPDAPQ